MSFLAGLLCLSLGGGVLRIETDMARYEPGRPVEIHVFGAPAGEAAVRLRILHLDSPVWSATARQWTGDATYTWPSPRVGHGFMATADLVSKGGRVLAEASCGIDVSSHWTDFPRYGYLAHFGPELAGQAPKILERLARFHVDGIQFYDWQWRHHHPLSPDSEWRDIANRLTSASTVRSFIEEAHRRNMACMAYNLGFGGVDGYDQDGISPSWLLYHDRKAQEAYALSMPAGWATTKLDIFDPNNPNWRSAIYPRESEALRKFGFDGWHMDQLGDLGKVYDAQGRPVVVKDGFPALLAGAKESVPGDLIFNNVGGYGLDETIHSPVDAVYLEAWPFTGQKSYADLHEAIERMRVTGKSAILAAYMDYESAKRYEGHSPGVFNLPGVLFTDATIFASGGFHIELGDGSHMLCNEYFPNHNLEPDEGLLRALEPYYDFAVAYEDLLSGRDVHPADLPAKVEANQPVWSFARTAGERTVIHLINLAQPERTDWRDPQGTMSRPVPCRNVDLELTGDWRSAFVATPDDGLGLPMPVPIRDGHVVVPRLEYWSVVVLQR